jgi:predicted nucleotidyltransferase
MMGIAGTESRLIKVVEEHPYPLIFTTVSGAHLYGFPSPDSDYDLRGVHVLPVTDVIGLDPGQETIELSETRYGLEIDMVTHDIRKFFLLLLKKNGYVLEQLYSPLIVHTTPEHEELKEIARGCITRHHVHHYLGFAQNQWKLFEKEEPRRVKPLLYTFRVLLTGIHMMRTGEVEANLISLNEEAKLPYIDELVSRKVAGAEQSVLDDTDTTFYESEYKRLEMELRNASEKSSLPEFPTSRDALNDLLVRTRLKLGVVSHGMTYFKMACDVDVPPNGAGTTCPVCGLENAFSEPACYDICERCGWEDDPVQFANPDFPGGANKSSLKEARAHCDDMIMDWQKKMHRTK